MPTAELYVEMLGGFTLKLDRGQALPPVRPRSAAVLLAFLIHHRDRPQTRDLLAGRFWSEYSEEKARRRLSNALWHIGKATEAWPATVRRDLLVATPDSVQFNPDVQVEVDVDAFVAALDEFERRYQADRRRVDPDELADIVGSYRGELLAGYYEEWIGEARRELNNRYLHAVDELRKMYAGLGSWEQALRHARTLVEAEPGVEEHHRELIRLHALNGRPWAAERAYEHLGKVLREEFGAEPSVESASLIEQVRSDSARPVVDELDEDAVLPLVGRAAERQTLLGRVNEVVSGKGGVVLIEGEAGIGKSKLMEDVAAGAAWRGLQVLTGGHSPTSPLTPYEGIRVALGPATTGLKGERVADRLNPVLVNQAGGVLEGLLAFADPAAAQALRPDEELWRTTEALAQVILAQGKPLSTMIVLEDVHWCDEESMQVLGRLGDRLIESGVLVCLTYQRAEAQQNPAIWRGLAEVEAMPGSTRLVLGPMAEDEVRELVLAELGPGRMPEPELRALIEAAEGNPYVVLEAVRSPVNLFEGDRAVPGGSAGAESGMDLLPAVAEILRKRIGAVSDEVRLVLEGLALLAVPADSSVVAQAVGLPRARVTEALAEAVHLGFVTEGPSGCEFTQAQTRLALEEQVASDRRAGIHRRIVEQLTDRIQIGTEQLAHHAWQAEAWDIAYHYHRRAAEAARRVNAYRATAEHLAKADTAAQRAEIGDGDRIEELFDYEAVLEVLGRREEQQILLDRLAGVVGGDAEAAVRVSQRQAWVLAHTDRGADAVALALQAIEKGRGSGINVGELLTIVGCARAWSGDLSGAVEPLEMAVAELTGDGRSALAAQIMLGRTYGDLHKPVLAHCHLEAAYEAAREANTARDQVEALGHLAVLHLSEGHETRAEAAFREALELAVEIGYRHGEGLTLVNLAAFYLVLGRGGRAMELLARAGDVFSSLGNGRGEAFVKLNEAGLAHFVLGDDETASTLAQEAAVFFRRANDELREAMCHTRLAFVDRRQGRRRMAKKRLLSALDRSSPVEDPTTVVQIHHHLALVELDLGHPDTALGCLPPARRLIDEIGLETLRPASLVIEARAQLALGQAQEAVALVNRSIPLNGPSADLAHLVAWWSAEVLTEAGEWEAAGQQVALAHELLTRQLEGVPDALAQRSWSVVPEHRAIVEQREHHFVEKVERRLPSVDAPVGRPVADHDLVDVVLTLSHPDDRAWPVAADRRRQRVLRLTGESSEQGAAIRVADLAELLGCDQRTIKRDLVQLRAEGYDPPLRGRPDENIS
jgi:DNA-binding SARP family transcriptional activator